MESVISVSMLIIIHSTLLCDFSVDLCMQVYLLGSLIFVLMTFPTVILW